jgi:hypothetical protein
MLIWMLHIFQIYVACILSRCCVCKCIMCFWGVFVSVLDAYFKCFICIQTYVASVASGCFNSRSVVASRLPRLLLPRLGVYSSSRRWLAAAASSPLFTMLVMFGVARARVDARSSVENGLQTRASKRPVRPDVRVLASLHNFDQERVRT